MTKSYNHDFQDNMNNPFDIKDIYPEFLFLDPVDSQSLLLAIQEQAVQKKITAGIPIFGVYNIDNLHWVSFAILKTSSEAIEPIVLYKDSCSNVADPNFLRALSALSCTIIAHGSPDNTEQPKDDRSSCGILALRNMEVMAEQIKLNQVNFIEIFPSYQGFSIQKEAIELRRNVFADKYQIAKEREGEHLTARQELRTAYDRYIDDLANFLRANLNSQGLGLNLVPIYGDDKSTTLIGKDNAASIEARIDIDTNLVYLMIKYTSNVESSIRRIIKDLAKNFIEQQDIDINIKYGDDYASSARLNQPVSTRCSDGILQDSAANIAEQKSERSAQQDPEEPKRINTANRNEIIANLRRQYNLVKHQFAECCNWDIARINQWATSKKETKLTDSDDDICTAIAIMDRANALVTGHRLRDSQILSVLTFLRSGKDKGTLSQINTGEGKTTIVSLLAVIKCLQGEKVDIITSNQVLASDGVNNRGDFYGVFGLSVANSNADENYKQGPRGCYTADVLYGAIGNFQFDFLRDSFLNFKTRANRPFGTVIIDEVDSMLIDNGGHIAKLSAPLPGMDSLRYVYIKIWDELAKAFNNTISEIQTNLQQFAEKLKNDETLSYEEAQERYDAKRNQLLGGVKKSLKEKVILSNPCNLELIPPYLKEYANSHLENWVERAIYARFSCHLNRHYVIKQKKDKEGNEEDVIVPVDYANTGVTLKNTIWSEGLHQFLQLKHSLYLTSESLTSSFISNVGYIKKYGNKIFGLTGTLGSKSEQELLSTIYNVNFVRIPQYKCKIFEELDAQVVEDRMLYATVAVESLAQVDKNRAVLIICETVADVESIKKELELLKTIETGFTITTYEDEDKSKVADQPVQPRDIIIATNIAGRGTDLDATALESYGGLHVCVCFLPCNKRVEDQAFGRTSRQGKKGTAQLIIKKSELEKLGISHNRDIKIFRDIVEGFRIKDIKENKLAELNFNDTIFSYFSSLYRRLDDDEEHDLLQWRWVLEDLKEFWAFWFDKNTKTKWKNKYTNLDPKEEYKQFESAAQEIIKGKIIHNPHYSIHQAEAYLLFSEHYGKREALNKAEAALNHAKRVGCKNKENNEEIIAAINFKLAEIAIEKGEAVRERFKVALGDLIGIDIAKDERYKTKANDYLLRAKSAISKEIQYMRDNFFPEPHEKSESAESSSSPRAAEQSANEKSAHLESIEVPDANKESASPEPKQEISIYHKHLLSRLITLQVSEANIDAFIEQLQESTKDRAGIAIAARTPDYIRQSKADFKKNIKDSEISELSAIGFGTLYALKEIHDPSTIVIELAKLQIDYGISFISAGIAFPSTLQVMGEIGGTLITEGISDIAFELLDKGDNKFDWKEYAKNKAISYGVSLAVSGLSAMFASQKILEKTISTLKRMSDALRKCRYMTRLCKLIANGLDRLRKIAERALGAVKFAKMTQAQQMRYLQELKYVGDAAQYNKLVQMHHLANLALQAPLTYAITVVGKSIAIDVGTNIAMSLVAQHLVQPALDEILKSLKPKLEERVRSRISERINREKLETAEQALIYKHTQAILGGNIALDIANGIAIGIVKHGHDWRVKLATFVIETAVDLDTIFTYAENFCNQLHSRLSNAPNVNANNNVESIIKQIVEIVSSHIYSLIVGLAAKMVVTIPNIALAAYKQHEIEQELNQQKKQWAEEKRNAEAAFKSELSKHCEVLGVNENASAEEINKAYRKKALATHPDINPDNPQAKEKFQAVNEAKQFLDRKEIGILRNAPQPHAIQNDHGSASAQNKDTNADAVSLREKTSDAVSLRKIIDDKAKQQVDMHFTKENLLAFGMDDQSIQHLRTSASVAIDDTGGGRNCWLTSAATLLTKLDKNGKTTTVRDLMKGFATFPVEFGTRFTDRIDIDNTAEFLEQRFELVMLSLLKQDQDYTFNTFESRTGSSLGEKLGDFLQCEAPGQGVDKFILAHHYTDSEMGHVVVVEKDSSGIWQVIDNQLNPDNSLRPVISLQQYIQDNNVHVYAPGYIFYPVQNISGPTCILGPDGNIIAVDAPTFSRNNVGNISPDDSYLTILPKQTNSHSTFATDREGDTIMGARSNRAQGQIITELASFLTEHPSQFQNHDYNVTFDHKLMDPSKHKGIIIPEERIAFFSIQNITERGKLFSLSLDSNSNNSIPVTYCPYIHGTCDWAKLSETEVIVPRNPDVSRGLTKEQYVFTGEFSGCSLLISVGNDNIKIYHDSKPESEVQEKHNQLVAGDRVLIRVDYSEYQQMEVDKLMVAGDQQPHRIFYASHITDDDLEKSNGIRANIYLSYNEGWHVNIQDLLGYNTSSIDEAHRSIPLDQILGSNGMLPELDHQI